MLKQTKNLRLSFNNLFTNFFSFLYRQMIFASRAAIIVGLIGSLMLTLNPSLDENIARQVIDSLVAKYNDLETEQRMQIKEIFKSIFLDE